MTDKILIRKTALFCPFCGKKLRKYEYDTHIQQECYAYCSACKREYSTSLISSDISTNTANGACFYWMEGDTRILDRIRKSKKA